MREALADRACCVEGVLKCYRHETLETVIDRIAKAEVAPFLIFSPPPWPLALSHEGQGLNSAPTKRDAPLKIKLRHRDQDRDPLRLNLNPQNGGEGLSVKREGTLD